MSQYNQPKLQRKRQGDKRIQLVQRRLHQPPSNNPDAHLLANVIVPVTSFVPSRPFMTLANGRLPNRYAGIYDCYDSESDPYSDYCSVHNLDDWLPKWMIQVSRPTSAIRPRIPDPQYSTDPVSDASCKNGSKPWRAKPMNEAVGPGLDCLNLVGDYTLTWKAAGADKWS